MAIHGAIAFPSVFRLSYRSRPFRQGSRHWNEFRNFSGVETGIENSEIRNESSHLIYDLNGRRVEKATKPGIYIVNGRKVVIK
jgi:hypothetical protein